MGDSGYRGYLYAASGDIAAIECLVRGGIDNYPEVIAFHAQQAAEKELKAALVSNGRVPPKTHDLIRLLSMCQEQLNMHITEP